MLGSKIVRDFYVVTPLLLYNLFIAKKKQSGRLYLVARKKVQVPFEELKCSMKENPISITKSNVKILSSQQL